MEYEKKLVLFLQLVGVVCTYENKNIFGFNGNPSLPSVIEDVFKMGAPIVTVCLCCCIFVYYINTYVK